MTILLSLARVSHLVHFLVFSEDVTRAQSSVIFVQVNVYEPRACQTFLGRARLHIVYNIIDNNNNNNMNIY